MGLIHAYIVEKKLRKKKGVGLEIFVSGQRKGGGSRRGRKVYAS